MIDVRRHLRRGKPVRAHQRRPPQRQVSPGVDTKRHGLEWLGALLILGAFASFVFQNPPPLLSDVMRDAPGQTMTVTSVIDGDTIRARPTNQDRGRGQRIRVVGIDTPETYPQAECGGPAATAAAKRLLKSGTTITALRDPTQRRRDTYGRLLAFIELPDGRDFGQVMLRAGHARSITWARQPRHEQYARAQNVALQNVGGLWANCSAEH